MGDGMGMGAYFLTLAQIAGPRFSEGPLSPSSDLTASFFLFGALNLVSRSMFSAGTPATHQTLESALGELDSGALLEKKATSIGATNGRAFMSESERLLVGESTRPGPINIGFNQCLEAFHEDSASATILWRRSSASRSGSEPGSAVDLGGHPHEIESDEVGMVRRKAVEELTHA
ncbi:hypothetical protein FA13DRAFT_1709421 [Coprinellus micaceus]|uniref:Uncharacterized protein n=1 Tax=Coprinellus micaceus TaxID=71717 RepID=A0A4Y7TEK0_COPMI|nr:hypothetical protein FA13DRAFT_1709421 [Coprinellus micaceus]